MNKVCDFGKEIKLRLVEINQSQAWLIDEVKKDTGKYFDSGYLHRILRGELSTPGIVASIRKILDLPHNTTDIDQ
ncbi:MAG: XRE family transcriptional regulator [Oscillospiraceae bacterium]|nr:XRE family transcriptional regulator [Oscillospiraceae bacterium]